MDSLDWVGQRKMAILHMNLKQLCLLASFPKRWVTWGPKRKVLLCFIKEPSHPCSETSFKISSRHTSGYSISVFTAMYLEPTNLSIFAASPFLGQDLIMGWAFAVSFPTCLYDLVFQMLCPKHAKTSVKEKTVINHHIKYPCLDQSSWINILLAGRLGEIVNPIDPWNSIGGFANSSTGALLHVVKPASW